MHRKRCFAPILLVSVLTAFAPVVSATSVTDGSDTSRRELTMTRCGVANRTLPGQPEAMDEMLPMMCSGAMDGAVMRSSLGKVNDGAPNGILAGNIFNPRAMGTAIGSSADASLVTVSAVPEPATFSLLAIGMLGLAISARSRLSAIQNCE
jgi:hypothetical protein